MISKLKLAWVLQGACELGNIKKLFRTSNLQGVILWQPDVKTGTAWICRELECDHKNRGLRDLVDISSFQTSGLIGTRVAIAEHLNCRLWFEVDCWNRKTPQNQGFHFAILCDLCVLHCFLRAGPVQRRDRHFVCNWDPPSQGRVNYSRFHPHWDAYIYNMYGRGVVHYRSRAIGMDTQHIQFVFQCFSYIIQKKPNRNRRSPWSIYTAQEASLWTALWMLLRIWRLRLKPYSRCAQALWYSRRTM